MSDSARSKSAGIREKFAVIEDIKPSDILPTNDLAFKYMLGSEESTGALIYFLNCAKVSKDPVVSVTMLNSEIVRENIYEKMTRIDILAKTDKNETIVIEMQCWKDYSMVARVLYYWSVNFLKQIGRSERYGALTKVICITILNYVLFPKDDRFWRVGGIRDKAMNEDITDLLELQFIELPKSNVIDENNPLTLWAEFLKNPYSKETQKICKKVPQIKEAKNMFEKSIADPKKFELMREREHALWEYQSALADERERGIERGAYSKAIESAKKMLVKGFDLADIADIVGLSPKEVQRLM